MTSGGKGPKVVCFPFVGKRVGGSHISAVKLIKALDRLRYIPLVVVDDVEGAPARLFTRHGLDVVNAPQTTSLAKAEWQLLVRSVLTAKRFANFLKFHDVSIVHTNDGFTHPVWALPARLAGARFVWHHRAGPKSRGIRFLAPWAADAVISVSKFATPPVGPWSVASRCTVVPSPFDTHWASIDRARCRDSVLHALGLPPSSILLGFFANLDFYKRPLVFVETVAAMCRQAPELAIFGLIFGEVRNNLGDAVLKRAAELGVASYIRLMGFHCDPERWLAACDCLIVPAVGEPFGRTLIEAMILGTPVIAAASGGNIEAIRNGETGLLVPVDNPEAFAACAHALVTNPQVRAALVNAARSDALNRFGIDRHASAVMRIYDDLIQSDTRSSQRLVAIR